MSPDQLTKVRNVYEEAFGSAPLEVPGLSSDIRRHLTGLQAVWDAATLAAGQVPSVGAHIAVNLHIGQRVLLRERIHGAAWHPEARKLDRTALRIGRIEGIAREWTGDGAYELKVHVTLERPIVIPARDEWPANEIWHQHVHAEEVLPYSDVDEILDALKELVFACNEVPSEPGEAIPSASQRYANLDKPLAVADMLLDRYTEKGDALAEALALQADRQARGQTTKAVTA